MHEDKLYGNMGKYGTLKVDHDENKLATDFWLH